MPIEWIDPPERRGRKPIMDYNTVLDELKQRPGQWAKVFTGPTPNSLVPPYQQFKQRGCETTSRKLGPEEYALFVRYESF